MSKYKQLKLKNRELDVMIDGEGNAYTPQTALMCALEERPSIHRMCIDYIDKKRDEVRNEHTI